MGLNHVTRGGEPLTFPLSPTVTLTKVSVGPGDNDAYLLQAGDDLLLVDARTGRLHEGDRLAILADVQGQLGEFANLVGDLVQLSRDDGEATPEPLDFRHVVTAALERARRRGSGLDFDVELDPCYVVGVSDALERAVTNLLDNAVKYTDHGGLTLRCRADADGVGFEVEDTGVGIAPEHLHDIFASSSRSGAPVGVPTARASASRSAVTSRAA